jgi:hypothetical protein
MPPVMLVFHSIATSIFIPGAAVLPRTRDDGHSTRALSLSFGLVCAASLHAGIFGARDRILEF